MMKTFKIHSYNDGPIITVEVGDDLTRIDGIILPRLLSDTIDALAIVGGLAPFASTLDGIVEHVLGVRPDTTVEDTSRLANYISKNWEL